jgi:single-strand DNA-binding protein
MKSNSCFLVGNLGMDPVERGRSEKSGPVVGFSIAENVQSFDPESKTYKTTHTNWFQVTTFGSMAERVKRHLKKGDRVALQGRMKLSKYTSKAGDERTSFEILADDVAFWKSVPAAQAEGHDHSDSDDLPF